MPVLSDGTSWGREHLAVADRESTVPSAGPKRRSGMRQGFLDACSNPGCASGWLHLWRSRSAGVFEGGWSCSADCTAERIQAAVRREREGRGNASGFGTGSGTGQHRHRVPLGLLMLEQGWITAPQLRSALDAQRTSGGRLGQWLVRREGISESLVTRALSLQWSCPVLPLEFHDAQALAPLVPRVFVDAFGALPLRLAAGKLLYVGFEERLDPALALAIERMTGLRVESGLVAESEFRPAHQRMLSATFPAAELLETASEPVLVRALTRVLERTRPVESRLVGVHDCLWLRMWDKAYTGIPAEPGLVHDVIATVGG
jgi:hypothetical protein